MSYILDALRRADQERNLGEVPKLDMALQSTAAAERPRRWPTVLLIICLATAVAVIAWLIEQSMFENVTNDAAEPPAVPQLATVVEPNQAKPQAALPKPQPAPLIQPQVQPEPQVRSQAAVQEPAAAAVQPAPKPQPIPAPAPAPAVPQTVEEPAVADVPSPSPAPEVTVDNQRRSARLPTPTVAPAPSPNWARDESAQPARSLPAPREGLVSYLGLSKSTRDSMPALNMNAHVFSTNPARGFVLINSKRYRIGDYLAEGPELVDILPDGAVLKHRGTEFLLPVQR